MSIVATDGVWASTDNRLVLYPGGRIITNNGTKHVLLQCRDGRALVSYTGLGRIGTVDVSSWLRGVLRGEYRTVEEYIVDMREQATARFGLAAHRLGIQHVFLVGALTDSGARAITITNFRPSSLLGAGGTQPIFNAFATQVSEPILLHGGLGWSAVREDDRVLLGRILERKPRDPEEYMKLVTSVNRRAAASGRQGARTISQSCNVVYMPTTGTVKEWYGYGAEGTKDGGTFDNMSSVMYGVDMREATRPLLRAIDGLVCGDEFQRQTEEALERATVLRDRRFIV